ncbi:MAG: 6-phosphofructokinase, partial [Silvanigrellaceae bacterium]|nr:6-phosphofructokinase [Silvanigrellaceae bacterium]
WISAASALAKFGFDCEKGYAESGPHLIYFPEKKFEKSKFLKDVQEVYNKIGRATIVVAEGVADNIDHDKFTGEADEFGNAQFSGSGQLGDYLAYLVKENIVVNRALGKIRCRADTLGYMQRSFVGMASSVDQQEAFLVGSAAVRYMMSGESDKMVTLVRTSENPYRCSTSLCDLSLVAQKTKHLPQEMINASGNGVSQLFFDYALPLIDGIPKVAMLNPSFVSKKLTNYIRD